MAAVWSPLAWLQKRITPPSPAEAIVLASADRATALTALLWPESCFCAILRLTRAVPGETARLVIEAVAPGRSRVVWPLAEATRRTCRSEATAVWAPSGDTASAVSGSLNGAAVEREAVGGADQKRRVPSLPVV